MKRKKRGGNMATTTIGRASCSSFSSSCAWMLTLFVWGSVAVVGAHSLSKREVKDPTALDKLSYQWAVNSPRLKETGHGAQILPLRRLLATTTSDDMARETTSAAAAAAAPAEEDDKTWWEEVEEFYSDNNNMAMYCVLPLIVLVYGGCSAIYCIYKCRRYFRRKGKHKRLRNEDSNSMSGDERNDLNQDGSGDGQAVKTVSGATWAESNDGYTDVGYNVQRKKTPLPWDTPQKTNQDSFAESNHAGSRDGNYSAGSRDSTALALEREREKLERTVDNKPMPPPHPPEESRQRPPPPSTTNTIINSPAIPPQNHQQQQQQLQPRPIEIVPISQKEYQRHMEASGLWDPLHNRPFESRASSRAGGGGGGGGETERSRNGRESSWSIRDEIMAKYDALTSLAMAKKTADVLRNSSTNDPNNLDQGHRPDTLRRKPGKKKLIFIAE